MQKYQFTGHLRPLPPGIKQPFEISGEVYLPSDVEARIRLLETALTKIIAEAEGAGPQCTKMFLRMGLNSARNIARKALGL